MASTTQFLCLACSKRVFEHHQAVECEGCKGWQHRGCGNTGISRYMYAKMNKGLFTARFVCETCSGQIEQSVLDVPAAESTRMSLAADLTAEADSVRMDVTDATPADQTGDEMDIDDGSLHLPPVQLPDALNESSIVDRTEVEDATVDAGPQFTIVPRGTARGKDLLVEGPGYSYTVRKQTATTRFWWCSVRRQGNRCPAAVSERGGVFNRSSQNHSHPADPGCLLKKQLSRQVKDTAAGNVFRSAMDVVEEQLQDVPTAAADNLPKPDDLVRKANRFRQQQRPEDPRAMDFELATDHIPANFLQKDVTVDGARHLLFSTPHQLELLSQAKTLYLDGTFKVIRSTDVFDQLFGIHAFVKKGRPHQTGPTGVCFHV